MSVIRWENPPLSIRGLKGEPKSVIAHELIVRELKRHPGEWAVIHEQRSASALSTLIRDGRQRAYRPVGTFEATSRWIGGVHTTYARYVGGPS